MLDENQTCYLDLIQPNPKAQIYALQNVLKKNDMHGACWLHSDANAMKNDKLKLLKALLQYTQFILSKTHENHMFINLWHKLKELHSDANATNTQSDK